MDNLSAKTFTDLSGVPYLFFGVPKDCLNFVKHRYNKVTGNITEKYDEKELFYKNLSELSNELGQGRNDFLLARFGLKNSIFYSNIFKRKEKSIYLHDFSEDLKYSGRSAVEKINYNTQRIESAISVIESQMSNGKSLMDVLDSSEDILNDISISVISTEGIINQINKNSFKYVELISSNDEIIEEDPKVPEFTEDDIPGNISKPEVNPEPEPVPNPEPEPTPEPEPVPIPPKDEIEDSEEEPVQLPSEEDNGNDENIVIEDEEKENDNVEPTPEPEEPELEPEPVPNPEPEPTPEPEPIPNPEPEEPEPEPEPTPDTDEDSTQEQDPPEEDIDENKLYLSVFMSSNINMVIGESINIIFKTNAEKDSIYVYLKDSSSNLGNIILDSHETYVFTAENSGVAEVIIFVTKKKADGTFDKLQKIVKIPIKEKYMEGYPIISEPDENGIKYQQDLPDGELYPLYPPFGVKWEKLLEEEKISIPAKILKPEHQKELDNGKGIIFDKDGKPQYAPSYKYLDEMTKFESDQIPFDNLLPNDKLALYGDVDGNIILENEVYYGPDLKPFSKMSTEEKKSIAFDKLYLDHKVFLYGNEDRVISYDNENYYPPEYKKWSELNEEEKKAIDQSILLKEDYGEIYGEKPTLEVQDDLNTYSTYGALIPITTNGTLEILNYDSEYITVQLVEENTKLQLDAIKPGTTVVTIKSTSSSGGSVRKEIVVNIAEAPMFNHDLGDELIPLNNGGSITANLTFQNIENPRVSVEFSKPDIISAETNFEGDVSKIKFTGLKSDPDDITVKIKCDVDEDISLEKSVTMRVNEVTEEEPEESVPVPSQLELNPSDPQTLEKGSNKKITVTKDVADYSVESKDISKVTVEKAEDGFTINAVEVTEGPVTVEVKTIAEEGKTETVKTLQVNVTY